MLVASITARLCLALLGVQPLEDFDLVLAGLAAKGVIPVGGPLSGEANTSLHLLPMGTIAQPALGSSAPAH